MANAKYICLDGEFRPAAAPYLFPVNRAFRYGDALFENIHAFSTRAQFPGYHFSSLAAGMSRVGMEIPPHFNAGYLSRLISQLLNRNKFFGGARVRLTVIRNGGEDIRPSGNAVSYILESQSLPDDHYVLNDRGFVIDVCTDYAANTGPLAGLKTTGAMMQVMTSLYCERNHLDEAVLLNERGRITGTGRYNIFLVSGSSLFTPGTDQGCIAGVMREALIKQVAGDGFRVNEQSSLTPAALEDADEVFLTNAVEGIRWVGAYRMRRYYRNTARLLLRKLNEIAFKDSDDEAVTGQFI